MTIRFELAPWKLWGVAHGSSAELDALQGILDKWSGQLAPEGLGAPPYIRKVAGEMGILSGALLAVIGTAPPGQMRSLLEIAQHATVTTALDVLVGAGLLRPYQAAAVLAAADCRYGRGILSLPPGAGKTRIAAALSLVLSAATGCSNVLYLCHSPQLVRQSMESIKRDLVAMGEVLSGIPVILGAGTYSALEDEQVEVDLLIVDECHRAACRTGLAALANVRAPWRIGMSGTPLDRTDDRNSLVIGMTGPVVYSLTIDELTHLGFLASGSLAN